MGPEEFLSTLSLRRATTIFAVRPYDAPIFLSTLSLRRATTEIWDVIAVITISIHALLAESDNSLLTSVVSSADFYPRSPCGERLKLFTKRFCNALFLSTLSLRRATVGRA